MQKLSFYAVFALFWPGKWAASRGRGRGVPGPDPAPRMFVIIIICYHNIVITNCL